MNPNSNFEKNNVFASDSSNWEVLVVHSNINHLQLPTYQLIDFCTLHHAQTELQAVEILETIAGIRLIISDLAMLTAENYRLLKFLKQSASYCYLPVINLLPLSESNGRVTTFCGGVRDFSLKEMDASEFSILVKELLEAGIRTTSGGVRTAYASGKLLTPDDIAWINHLECLVVLHLKDYSYTISRLAQDMHMSKSTLARKTGELLGMTPSQYITSVRMEKARDYLENRRLASVGLVSSAVGFRHASAFSRCFHNYFEVSPSEMMR